MYRPVLIAGPTTTPITLAEAKAQLDIAYSDKDDLITALIAAAVSHLDGWTGIMGRCLMPQTWRQDFDDFASCLWLPLDPVSSIADVKYTDTAGVEQTIASENYTLIMGEDGVSYVRFDGDYTFPAVNTDRPAVSIAYVAGYANAAAVPQAIKQAMLLMIRHWFDNPSAVVVGAGANPMPLAVDALLGPKRRGF